MRAQKVRRKQFEFYFPNLDTLLLVEHGSDDQVIIRATRDTFSQRRKTLFVKQLASEGFIPDSYQWFCGFSETDEQIKWIVDCSWLEISPRLIRRTNRFMYRLLFCAYALWIMEIGTVFLQAAQ